MTADQRIRRWLVMGPAISLLGTIQPYSWLAAIQGAIGGVLVGGALEMYYSRRKDS